MSSPKPQRPTNLTAAMEQLPWSELGQGLFVQGQTDTGALEVRGLDLAGEGYASEGAADTVYVIASGFGILRCGETALEYTAGDVVFVPSGQAHRFERLGGDIRIWRISAASGLANTREQH